ncbi:MAG: KH domain-containing protein [Clostridiaceae bacterium]|nr:KH domain-containing protein [Clostridiaceae bacterium]
MRQRVEATGKTYEDALQNGLEALGVDQTADVSVEVIEEGQPGGILGIGRKDYRLLLTINSKSDPTDEAEELTKEDMPGDEAVAVDNNLESSISVEAAEDDHEPEEMTENSSEISYVVEPNMDQTDVDDVYYGDDIETGLTEELSVEEQAALDFLQKVLSFFDLDEEITMERTEESLNIDIEGKNCGVIIGRRGETLNALQYLTAIAVNRVSDEYVRVIVDAAGYHRRSRERLEKSALYYAKEVKKRHAEYVMEPMSAADRRIVHFALQKVPGVTTESEGTEPNRCVVIIPTE